MDIALCYSGGYFARRPPLFLTLYRCVIFPVLARRVRYPTGANFYRIKISDPPAAAGAGCSLGGGYFPSPPVFRARARCGRGAVAFGSAVHSSKREHECRSDLVRRDAFLPNGAPSRRFWGCHADSARSRAQKKAARRRAQGARRWAAEKAAELTEPA